MTPLAAAESAAYVPLLVVILLAFAVPLLLSRFPRVPVVVGEIAAGVLVGRSGFGWVDGGGEVLAFLSEIGLAFLMFLAGMEIDFDAILGARGRSGEGGRGPLRTAFLSYLATLALAVPGALLLAGILEGSDPWLLACVLSATSLGVLLPVLKSRGLTKTTFGRTVLLAATLADFLTVILLTVYVMLRRSGFDPKLFALLLLFLAFLLAYRVGWRLARMRGLRRVVEELSHATVQLKVRAAIAVLMAFVVLARFVQAEAILGAFLAGMLVALLRGPEDEPMVVKLEAFGFGFFVPVFFVLVGAGLDLRELLASPRTLLALPAVLGVAIVVKSAPALLFRPALSGREVVGASLLLNTHLSLEIAVAVVGREAGLFSPEAATVLVLFAVVTVLVMPVLFGAIQAPAPAPADRFALLLGAGDLALRVAHLLRAHGDDVRFVEPDPERAARARADGFPVVDRRDPEAYRGARAAIAISTEERSHLEWCREAAENGVGHCVAFVSDPQAARRYEEAGIRALTPVTAQVNLIALAARNPDMLQLLTSTGDERDVRECVLARPSFARRELRRLGLPGEVLVLSIRRRGEILVPHGNTCLEEGDVLTLLGGRDALARAEEMLG